MPFLQPEHPHVTASGWLAPNPAGLTVDDHPSLHAWAAHVAAGRIGTQAPMPQEALDRIARMEAILRPARRGVAR